MFSSFLGQIKESLGKAFLLTVWLPALIFVSTVLTVYLIANKSLEHVWQNWLTLSLGGQGLITVGFLMGTTLVAFALYYVMGAISQFFEGYWEKIPGLSTLAEWRRQHYREYLEKLEKRIDQVQDVPLGSKKPTQKQVAEYVYLNNLKHNFPPLKEEVMPTRLGNLYRAAELYPNQRYGADAVVVWPLLRSVLPKDFAERMLDAKIAVDFWLFFSLLSMLFPLVTLPYLLVQGANILLILLCLLAIPIGIAAYHCALAPAQEYTKLIKVAFDLYRHSLLKTLDIELPATLAEERQLWKALSVFFVDEAEAGDSIHFISSQSKESNLTENEEHTDATEERGHSNLPEASVERSTE